MKNTILLLLFTSLSCFAQENFDQIKTLDFNTVKTLQDKIRQLNNTALEEKAIKNLSLFLENPFDRNIEKFDLSFSLKKLDEQFIINKIILNQSAAGTEEKDTDGDGVPDSIDKCPNTKGSGNNSGCPELQVSPISTISSLSTILPSGYSISTQAIDALSKFLVERTKQELTLSFYENFKRKLDKTIYITITENPKDSIQIPLSFLFSDTYTLFESKNYFETPSLGEVWLLAFKKDLNELPFKLETVLRQNPNFKATIAGHYALISADIMKKLNKGVHPLRIIEEVNDTYNAKQKYANEIDQMVAILQLLSKNLTTTESKDIFTKELNWVKNTDFNKLTEAQQRYLVGFIYQMGRNNTLFKQMKLKDGTTIEEYINQYNYNLLSQFIKKAVENFNTIELKLKELKGNHDTSNFSAEQLRYTDFVSTFYELFDQTFENYYTLIDNDYYYQSDYYLKYKPIITDIIEYNAAKTAANYAECWMITNRFIGHLFPKNVDNIRELKEISYCGNFMVDILNTAKNEGDLKVVLEKYAMPVSSYRIKRTFDSSWDVSAFPGLYLGYEFTGSNSLSYGLTAPVGISYSFKNSHPHDTNKKASASSIFFSVIDIGAPFSYRFTHDQAQGLPEDIKWEQVFSPGLFYIYGFCNSPLSIGLNAQFNPLLRKIEENNTLETKNIFRIGLTLLVDIPLFNLTRK